jgi:hypothetical protein
MYQTDPRRTFADEILTQWHEVTEIARDVNFTDMHGSMNPKGVYSSKCMYTMADLGAIKPVYSRVVRDFKIPHRIQVFVWLFARTKI